MANFQSFGVTPNSSQLETREFYKYGTQIELLMNKTDPNFSKLQSAMYCFLTAKTIEQKFSCNAPFVDVCQDILKTEWRVLKKELAEATEAPT